MDFNKATDLIKEFGSPLYCYDEDIMLDRFNRLNNAISYKKKKLLYACKANSNISIMKILRKAGAFIDAVSPLELRLAFEAGYEPDEILYTGDNTNKTEMEFCLTNGVMQNLGSLSQLESYGKIKPSSSVCIRINPDCGAGHHSHTITGGPNSKFGIYFDKVDEIKSICSKYSLKVIGLHSHIGSGILDVDEFLGAIDIVLNVAPSFSDLDFIDFGGGIGIPYKPSDKGIDIEHFGERLTNRFREFSSSYGKELGLYLEPGRYIIGESGVLLVTVNNIKTTPSHKFVGTDSGFNHLIRPMAYGSYHKLVNCSNREGELEDVAVTGNICESGDVFTQGANGIEDRPIAKAQEGDILAILDAGAYGYSMSSQYNSRLRPAEVLISNGRARLIRRRDTFADIISNMQGL